MDKSNGQSDRTTVKTSAERGETTRAAILEAAADLIAEMGWGGVSTRAIAERAGVPHGAVSYHFRGKGELLREAALAAIDTLFTEPLPALDNATVDDVIAAAAQWYVQGLTERRQALVVEVMMACTRDEKLRDRFAELLDQYRTMLADVIRAEQERGSIAADIDATALASALIAALDGMLLHTLAAPGYDGARAADALNALVYQRGTR
ncbi:TetR/AcrR family transcriptional regulator [Actinobacteria bacterium YIM 96077]|uniref:TetR/AcrR family transcriptional regulator n=1 Tax=Phytoactinopolyspora halophila TaxID=1981511 RepID=A0A329QZR2_9ACTN|nr:TetR/AcrR family transcriptional regulator [Phytoactinopolyspora halophila]AYY13146.1 TetR/AcrR family transcriptional regulator [Actinobacteria bacterium YIM 96077]RAW17613.1 TetR/AcrR family transcriptional regulator [Phytoactinopolyspora halophila]